MEHRYQHRRAAKGAFYWTIAALLFCGTTSFASTHPGASPATVEGLVVLDGQVRVQAVSAKLLRIEPLGPKGFEDNNTFMVSERFIDESAPALSILNQTNQIVWVSVAGTGSTPTRLISIALERRSGSVRSENDFRVSTSVYDQQHSGEVTAQWSSADLATVDAQLWWPDPLSTTSYAIQDFPRFTPPPWGPTLPPTRDIDEPLRDSSGYDFQNNRAGDVYVFILGDDLDGWYRSRREFLRLVGRIPALPTWAHGTWFTYFHQYTEAEAKGEIERWGTDDLPLDVWGLDMNWRSMGPPGDAGHFYNYSNTELFPDFADGSTKWFDYIHSKHLKTYFNDHPWPQGPQTSPAEVRFRWNGLTSWLKRGLDFWWFDANWGFTIPPPGNWSSALCVNSTRDGTHWFQPCVNGTGPATGVIGPGVPPVNNRPQWEGLDNRPWGAHVYYMITERFNNDASRGAPITLSMASYERCPGQPQCAEHPGHHRYPVHWTGDGVQLPASVSSMVNSGVNSFRPYTHSDCGGNPTDPNAMMRWTAHCALGSILRFHGCGSEIPTNCHQPWIHGNEVEDTVRKYLKLRYQMMPSLLAAGIETTLTGFPTVARGDLFWPSPTSSIFTAASSMRGETVRGGSCEEVNGSVRRDCGHPGITQQQCEAKRCCWNVTQPTPGGHVAVCFYAHGGPAPPPSPSPSPTPMPPTPPMPTANGWGANASDQYLFVNDTLVAPIMSARAAPDQRRVWIPPGEWIDAWNGSIVAGPGWRSVEQPVHRIPMWHRRGGLVVTVPEPGTRVELQDWSTLILEAFPTAPCSGSNYVGGVRQLRRVPGLAIPAAVTTRRVVYETNTSYALAASAQDESSASPLRTEIMFWPHVSDGDNSKVELQISSSPLSAPREFVLRLHLCHNQRVASATIDAVPVAAIEHLSAASNTQADHFPFRGIGQPPAPNAGSIAEVVIPVLSPGESRHVIAELVDY